MKKITILPILILVISMVVIISGCSSGGKETEKTIGEINEEIAETLKRVDLAHFEEFLFLDIAAYRAIDDSKSAYMNAIYTLLGKIPVSLHIGFDKVDCFTIISGNDCVDDNCYEQNILSIKGNIDFEIVRRALENDGSTGALYNGVEVWNIESLDWWFYDEVGLLTYIDDYLVIGTEAEVKGYIDVALGKTTPFYGNDAIQDVLARIPMGYLITVGNGDELDGHLIWASSTFETTIGMLGMKSIYKYSDANTAHEGKNKIEAEISSGDERKGVSNRQVIQNDVYVFVTSDIDIEEYYYVSDEDYYNALETERQNVILAMTALMADNGSDSVKAQTTWTNDVSGDITASEHPSISEYLENAESMKAYYQWNSSGKVYQCEDTSCPDPF